ncbi:MAG TPA: STAS domain-containing protein [Nitrospiraceae bacterium]|jgi:anti-anti-sigma regulatory factor|nr:STAS domain-containing protein [Nitrospiraceae bacterium]
MSSPQLYVPTCDLTIATVTEFKAALVDMMSDGKSGTLDLAGVQRVDAAALQVMIAAERTGCIALTNPSLSVKKAMEAIGFTPASAPSDGDVNEDPREKADGTRYEEVAEETNGDAAQ